MAVLQLALDHWLDLVGRIRARLEGPDFRLAKGKRLSADRQGIHAHDHRSRQ